MLLVQYIYIYVYTCMQECLQVPFFQLYLKYLILWLYWGIWDHDISEDEKDKKEKTTKAVQDLNPGYHNMDILKTVWYLNYGNLIYVP